LPIIERPELIEEVASGAAGDAECATAECFTSCADDQSRLLSGALPFDFPNMLLSLLVYSLTEIRTAYDR
jgi:hypothetical protein